MKLTDHVLSEDAREANKLIIWASYCITQMDYCIHDMDLEASRHYCLEHQRAVNDLKALKFKKINSERVGIDVEV